LICSTCFLSLASLLISSILKLLTPSIFPISGSTSLGTAISINNCGTLVSFDTSSNVNVKCGLAVALITASHSSILLYLSLYCTVLTPFGITISPCLYCLSVMHVSMSFCASSFATKRPIMPLPITSTLFICLSLSTISTALCAVESSCILKFTLVLIFLPALTAILNITFRNVSVAFCFLALLTALPT